MTTPTKAGSDVEREEAAWPVVLTSQLVTGADGFEVHGVFPSYRAAALHVVKDADLGPAAEQSLIAAWSSQAPSHQYTGPGFDGQATHWCASLQPIRDEDGRSTIATPTKAGSDVERAVEAAYREGYRDSPLHGGPTAEDSDWRDSRANMDLHDARRLAEDALATPPIPVDTGAREVHGLGPHAIVIEDGVDGFKDVAVLVGGCVYVKQGGAQITMSGAVAAQVASVLLPAALPSSREGEVTLAEAARDLLDARKRDERTVGYRTDLWNCLAATLGEDVA